MRVRVKGGVWKNTEDEILKAAIMKYGKNNWPRVASLLPRKTAKQVSGPHQRHCLPRLHARTHPLAHDTVQSQMARVAGPPHQEDRVDAGGGREAPALGQAAACAVAHRGCVRRRRGLTVRTQRCIPPPCPRTAPLVGRTAPQCLERYEKLLDEAQGKDLLDARDDPRKLRPGEIDPHPEIKPARPDPVDMDEEELDMLTEARARLANTQGKKAKRKARERQLEEARRLAALQKHRELKAAGLAGSRRRRRKREEGIDYATEIPFQKDAPAGFFDVGAEDAAFTQRKAKHDFNAVHMQRLEASMRARQEATQAKTAARAAQRLEATNLPRAIAESAARNDVPTMRKRPTLALPAPTVTDAELRDIVKAGRINAKAAGAVAEAEGDTLSATATLVAGLVGGAGGTTPALSAALAEATLRTPAQSSGVLESARQLAALTAAPTPLQPANRDGDNAEAEGEGGDIDDSASATGGEEADAVLAGGHGTGFRGATPDVRRLATPNPLASAAAAARSVLSGATPASSVLGGGASAVASAVASGTPLSSMLPPPRRGGRGGLDLPPPSAAPNDAASVQGSVAGDSVVSGVTGVTASTFGGRGQRGASVKAALASLPAPKYEVDVLAPEDMPPPPPPSRPDAGTSSAVADAEDVAAAEAAAAAAEASARRLLISSALRAQPPLPRPYVVDEAAVAPPLGSSPNDLDIARGMVADEVLVRLLVDAVEAPPAAPRGVAVRVPSSKPVQAPVSPGGMRAAARLVDEEAGADGAPPVPAAGAWPAPGDFIFLPSSGQWLALSQATPAQRLEAARGAFDRLAAQAARAGKALDKAEKKQGVLLGGFMRRTGAARAAEEVARAAETEAAHKLRAFMALAAEERSAMVSRVAVATAETREVVAEEEALQKEYARLKEAAAAAGLQVAQ